VTTEFINDPIVPLQLKLTGGERYTLYQPGWYTADDGSAGFLGATGRLYGFETLADLVTYVDSGATNDLTPSPHLRALRIWPEEEYARRLCFYDMTQLPEIVDGHLDADEQASLGSTLALMLDLLDFMDIETADAQALHDDEDISKLASGDEVLAVFRAAHHRQHVVELLGAHWTACLAEVSERVITPEVPQTARKSAATPNESGTGTGTGTGTDGSPLEDAAEAVTFWLGLADEGVYAARSTVLADGTPRYSGSSGDGSPRLTVWTDLDQMRTDLIAGVGAELDLSTVVKNPEVSLTPHDDCIFDLVEIADSITEEMDQQAADKVVSAWTELVRLSRWGGWSDVTDLLALGSPAGDFVVSCAVDLAQDRPGAAHALGSADLAAAAEGWRAVVPALTAHFDIRN
jgi:hypothetical protein